MRVATFNGWKKSGRVVKAGERAVSYNEYGDAVFGIHQTKRIGDIETITIYRDRSGRFVRNQYVKEMY